MLKSTKNFKNKGKILALKDDLAGVKEQIGTEEQFLENIIKSELFVKKYKKPIIAIFAVLVLGFAGYYSFEFMQNSKAKSVSEIYSNLMKNPNDENLKAKLKSENIDLYALFEMQNGRNFTEILQNPKLDPILKEILNIETGKNSEILLSDYQNLLKGFELLKAGKIDAAKIEFNKIPTNSPLKSVAENLQHYNG